MGVFMLASIVYAMILTLVQAVLPTMFGIASGKLTLPYLLGARDEQIQPATYGARAKRAFANLQESLPVFFTLAILAIILDKDVSQYAGLWLIARVVYVPAYVIDIPYIRTMVWLVSLACLVLMAMALMA
jgi:uncharacterized MAPEG superfamily protein